MISRDGYATHELKKVVTTRTYGETPYRTILATQIRLFSSSPTNVSSHGSSHNATLAKVNQHRTSQSRESENEELLGQRFERYAVQLGKPKGGHRNDIVRALGVLVPLTKLRDEQSFREALAKLKQEEARNWDGNLENEAALVWDMIRWKEDASLDQIETKDRAWGAKQVVLGLSNHSRAGYLWSVLIDALNKSNHMAAADLCWDEALVIRNSRPQDFVTDDMRLFTAVLSGHLGSGRWHKVPPFLEHMVSVFGNDFTSYSLTRCLRVSPGIYRSAIADLPNWQGKPLNLKFQAVDLVPLFAESGRISEARSLWITENTAIYQSRTSESTDIDNARTEIVHLLAGAIAFARHPHLEPPHDSILRSIISRLTNIVTTHPSLCSYLKHLHWAISETGYVGLSVHLGILLHRLTRHNKSIPNLSSLFSTDSIVLPVLSSLLLHGDEKSYKYWEKRCGRLSPQNIKLFCDPHHWILKFSHIPIENAIEWILSASSAGKINFRYIAFADSIFRRRNALSKLQHNSGTGQQAASSVSMATSSPLMDSAIDVLWRPTEFENLAGLDDASYQAWTLFLPSLRQNPNLRQDDMLSAQRVLRQFLASGMFEDAESFIFAPYRTLPVERDLLWRILLYYYVEQSMFPQLLKFLKLTQRVRKDTTIARLHGPNLDQLLSLLEAKQAHPQTIFRCWDEVSSSPSTHKALSLLARQAMRMSARSWFLRRFLDFIPKIPASSVRGSKTLATMKELLAWTREKELPQAQNVERWLEQAQKMYRRRRSQE